MRNAALRSVLRRMGVQGSTPTEEGRSGEERENPESEPDHPVHSGGASEEMRSNVSWNPEGQATEEEPRRDKRSGRDKLFGRPRQAEGPETEEQKKIRLTEEAMLARTRMEVFKSLHKRNKRQTKEMMLELGTGVDNESVKKGSGLFEDEPEGVEGLEHEECDYSPTTPEEMEEEMERRFHQLKAISEKGAEEMEEEAVETDPDQDVEQEDLKGKGKIPQRVKPDQPFALQNPHAPWPVVVPYGGPPASR